MSKLKVRGFVNPLKIAELTALPDNAHVHISEAIMINFLCSSKVDHDISDLLARYEELGCESEDKLAIMVCEGGLEDAFVQPIASAKSAYILGDFQGVIALCGMIAERLAIRIFRSKTIYLSKEKNITLTPKSESILFGSKFEKLPHVRRTEILFALRCIKKELFNKFETIRNTRNTYLHDMPPRHDIQQRQAKKIYHMTLDLLVLFFGYQIKDGMLILRLEMEQFLKDLNRRTEKKK